MWSVAGAQEGRVQWVQHEVVLALGDEADVKSAS